MNPPAFVSAITLDRRFLLLSNGAIMLAVTTADSIDMSEFIRLRAAKYKTAELRRIIFEPCADAKQCAKAQKQITAALKTHSAKDAASRACPYRKAQGAGPWPQPARRRRKRLIAN